MHEPSQLIQKSLNILWEQKK